MNVDKKSSEEIVVLLREADSLCNESLLVVKENEALGIVKVYGRLAGSFMGHAYVNILSPIWEAYPELRPLGWRIARQQRVHCDASLT
jgi:hypothetical protein